MAIAVGAFTLTLTLAAGNGIRDYTDRLVADNFDPTELIVGLDKEIENTGAADSAPKEYDPNVGSISFGGDGGSLQVKQIDESDITALKKLPYVDDVRPNYQLSARYITRDDEKKYTLSIQAYNPGQKPEIVAGDMPGKDLAEGSVLLPEAYVDLLDFSSPQDALGKKVQVAAQQPFTQESVEQFLRSPGSAQAAITQTEKLETYTVAAVTKQGVATLNPTGLPVFVGSTDAKELYDFTTEGTPQYGKYLYAFVRVNDAADEKVAQDVKGKLKDQGYYVLTSQDIQQTIRQFVNVLQSLVAVFGVITIIASVFGIVNTMYISVLQRTREIGLMKALGMRSRAVAWLFRLEAAWIGFIGGAVGALLAWLLSLAINPWLTESLSLGAGNAILVHSLWQILALISVLVLVAILAGWLPARKAAKLDPIEALRTE